MLLKLGIDLIYDDWGSLGVQGQVGGGLVRSYLRLGGELEFFGFHVVFFLHIGGEVAQESPYFSLFENFLVNKLRSRFSLTF